MDFVNLQQVVIRLRDDSNFILEVSSSNFVYRALPPLCEIQIQMDFQARQLETLELLAVLFDVVKELYRRFDPRPGVFFSNDIGPHSSNVAFLPGTAGFRGPTTPPGPPPMRDQVSDPEQESEAAPEYVEPKATPERPWKRRRQH